MTNENAKSTIQGLLKVYHLYAAPEQYILDAFRDKTKFSNQEKEVISHLAIRKPSGGGMRPMLHPDLDFGG